MELGVWGGDNGPGAGRCKARGSADPLWRARLHQLCPGSNGVLRGT
jgi:hypothetical protein